MSNNEDDVPLFIRTYFSAISGNLREIPTGRLPPETSQHVIDTIADQTKAKGDRLYREQKWEEARAAYEIGVGLQPSDPNVRKVTLLNLAATNLQLKQWVAVLRDTFWILTMDPGSVKALYRAARALAELGAFPEALDCCERALKLEPHNRPLQEEHRTVRQEVIRLQQQQIAKAYKYHHLIIIPTEEDVAGRLTTQSCLMPYLDPPVPEEPANAMLFCNLNILYVERCSADSVTDFPFDKPILPLLDTYLPGSTPKVPASTQYDIALQPDTSLRIQSMDITHPTNWDPKYEFEPSGLSLYVTTQRGNIICVVAGMTLADVCAEAKRISPGPPDQKGTYRDDGEYIKIMEGMITVYAFRNGSEAQKRFIDKENFGNFVKLADPEYAVPPTDFITATSGIRRFNYGLPNQVMNDPDSTSFAARQGLLRQLVVEGLEMSANRL